MKKILSILLALALMVTTSGVAMASGYRNGRGIDDLSKLLGKTITEIQTERQTGKTASQIAEEAGKLEEFQAKRIENSKARLDQRVENGNLTQAKADELYAKMQENIKNCDGTGSQQNRQDSLGTGAKNRQGNGNTKAGNYNRQGNATGKGMKNNNQTKNNRQGQGNNVRQFNCMK